jgi:nitroreductase
MTSPAELLASLRFRYATKQFDPSRKIPADAWEVLEQSLLLSPSSCGLQPWKFLVINTPELRESLKAASWGQSQVTDASHFVVYLTRTDFSDTDLDRWMECLAAAQGSTVESLSGYRSMITGLVTTMLPDQISAWNANQSYIALGQFMASAATLGIDTCPMEGLSPLAYDEILGLADTGYRTVFACAAGYRAATDKYALMPKARFPLAEVIEHR